MISRTNRCIDLHYKNRKPNCGLEQFAVNETNITEEIEGAIENKAY